MSRVKPIKTFFAKMSKAIIYATTMRWRNIVRNKAWFWQFLSYKETTKSYKYTAAVWISQHWAGGGVSYIRCIVASAIFFPNKKMQGRNPFYGIECGKQVNQWWKDNKCGWIIAAARVVWAISRASKTLRQPQRLLLYRILTYIRQV